MWPNQVGIHQARESIRWCVTRFVMKTFRIVAHRAFRSEKAKAGSEQVKTHTLRPKNIDLALLHHSKIQVPSDHPLKMLVIMVERQFLTPQPLIAPGWARL